ncbi:hypothetical protein TorRG33x02_041010 [Trema orientale]|uniref:Transmembrane protein n=1 Tax=Trema orientale TaxID=63057 RepID=A0A2P5FRA2_TREOI|nr:hypothetical protein TorRG33x02_041010 [Trema orientale]
MSSPKPTIGGGLSHTSTVVSFTLLPLFFPTKAEDTFCESSSPAIRALDLVTLTGFSSTLFFFITTFLPVSVFFLEFFFFDLKSSYVSDSDSTSVPTNINVSFSGLNLTFLTFLATTTESISLSASPKPLISVFSSSCLQQKSKTKTLLKKKSFKRKKKKNRNYFPARKYELSIRFLGKQTENKIYERKL